VTSSYGANTPFKIPSFGRVCISTNGAAVVDMANSFITMKLRFTLKFHTAMASGANTLPGARVFFIGWKNSLEAVSRYDIYVDSSKIYSQTWVGEESFIFNAGMSDSVRKRNPWSFTSWDAVKNMDPAVCGVYVTLSAAAIAAGDTFNIEIPVKINLHQFLVLSSVRYLPSFCGRWEIELYPSWENLVVAQVPVDTVCARRWPSDSEYKIGLDVGPGWKDVITWGFTQLGQSFHTFQELALVAAAVTGGAGAAGATVVPVPNYVVALGNAISQTISGVDGVCTEFLCSTTTFQLRYEVYEQLRNMYAENMLVIPTNILQYGRFSGYPSNMNDGTPFHATLSQNLENCDSIFILLPFNHGQRTCFYQPWLKDVRLSLGEFGIHPQQPVQTWDDPRFFHMLIDALNLEASEITGMNDDVLRTFMKGRVMWELTGPAAAGVLPSVRDFQEPWNGKLNDDTSNFFIGFSLSQIGFQSGTVTSPNSNVPFMFDAILDRPGGAGGIHETPNFDSSVVVMFLLDCSIMIQVVPDSDIPVVKLSSKSIV
jgi:hypothetical protein